MGQYVLGIDGGGTKTHCALFDIYGNKVDLIEWGATNHERLSGGFSELETVLKELITHILEKNKIQIDELKSSVFGLAGVDSKAQHKIITEIIKRIGINNFILCNDAYLGIKAGCPSGIGICAINGTGCTVAGINEQGDMLQIGGFGELTGDCGGGDYIAHQAISAVYNSLYKGYTKTVMSQMLFDMLKIHTKDTFMEALTQAISDKKFRYKDLNRIVFLAANERDAVALEILEVMGKENSKSINGLINEITFGKTIEIVLAGSIYAKGENPTAINVIKENVQNAHKDKDITFIVLDKPPVTGAIIWALGELHNPRDGSVD